MDRHSINHVSRKMSPNNSSPLKSEPPFSSNNTFICSNLAFFISDDENSDTCSGDNTVFSAPIHDHDDGNHSDKRRSSACFHMHANEEELKIREELAMEIEKELEREIMEGILVLVHRLSDLKAKQIARGHEVSDAALNFCHLCNNVNRHHASPQSLSSCPSWASHKYISEEEDEE